MADAVVTWVGDVDLGHADGVRADIDAALSGDDVDRLVVDTSAVTFIDSTGVGMLVQARKACLQRDVGLVLRGVPPRLRRLLTLAGLGEVFTFDDAPLTEVSMSTLPRRTPLPAVADTPFDRVAALACRALGVSSALVTFVDQDGQVIPGAAGPGTASLTRRHTTLDESYCQYVVDRAAPLLVADISQEPLLAKVQAVAAIDGAAYAGVPVTGTDGRAVGALCVIDAEVRQWTAADVGVLRDLAATCSSELQLRQMTQHAVELTARVQAAEHSRQTLEDHLRGLAVLLAEARALSVPPAAQYLDWSIGALAAVMTDLAGDSVDPTSP